MLVNTFLTDFDLDRRVVDGVGVGGLDLATPLVHTRLGVGVGGFDLATGVGGLSTTMLRVEARTILLPERGHSNYPWPGTGHPPILGRSQESQHYYGCNA